VLRHGAVTVLIQVGTDPYVRCYNLLKVGVLPRQYRDLGRAITVSGAQSQQSTRISCYTTLVHKSFRRYKKTLAKAKLQDTNMLKVLIYLTWCKRRNLD
jgi:hypothetical protein